MIKRLLVALLFLASPLLAAPRATPVLYGSVTDRGAITCDALHDGWVYRANDATSGSTCASPTGSSTFLLDCTCQNSAWSPTISAGGVATDVNCTDCVSLTTETVGNYVAAVGDGAGVVITGAAGEGATQTVATASTETNFLASGALTCGAATAGRMEVHTTPLQYCDNTATPTLRYSAYSDSTGNATGVACTTCVDATDLAANAVTLPKIVNATTNNRLLGRATSGSGNWEEVTVGTGLTFTGTTLSASASGVAPWDSETHVVTSDFTTTSLSVAGVDVTGLTFALVNGGVYEFDVLLQVNSSSIAGLQAGMGLSGTGTIMVWNSGATNGGAAADNGFTFSGAGGALGNNAFCTATSVECIVFERGIARPTAAGNLTVRVDKVTSGTTTVRIGSLMKVRRIP